MLNWNRKCKTRATTNQRSMTTKTTATAATAIRLHSLYATSATETDPTAIAALRPPARPRPAKRGWGGSVEVSGWG